MRARITQEKDIRVEKQHPVGLAKHFALKLDQLVAIDPGTIREGLVGLDHRAELAQWLKPLIGLHLLGDMNDEGGFPVALGNAGTAQRGEKQTGLRQEARVAVDDA